MTTPPTFPALPGQGWSVHKKPVFSTRVASHASGREVRAGLYAHALYEFELTFSGLDSSGGFPGLQSQSLQTLMGFFLTAQGQLNSFLYVDPSDSAVNGQYVGIGDGSTSLFTLGRSIGGYYEPVSYAISLSAVYLDGVPLATGYWIDAPNSLHLSYAPLGLPPIVQSLFETATTGPHSANKGLTAVAAGTRIICEVYVQPAGRTVFSLHLADGTDTFAAVFDTVAGTISALGNGYSAAALTNVGNGWFLASMTATTVGSTALTPSIWLYNAGSNNYTGTAGIGVYVAGMRLSYNNGAMAYVSGGYAGAANATLTTVSSPAPPPGQQISVSFSYAFQCRFLDDQMDFEEIMSGAWQNKSVKFRSIR